MKNNCKSFGSDEKGNGRAGNASVVGRMLTEYLDGKNSEAYDFAFGLCRDAEEARELVQEACYRVLRECHRFDPVKPVKSWLFTILRNAFMDSRRRIERKRGLSLDYEQEGRDSLHELLAANEEAVLARLEREETSMLIRKAMARLTRKDRKFLTLRDGEGMPYEEVARALRVPVGTVRSRVFRARRKLRTAALRCGLRGGGSD